ncbi:Uncharacterised protein [Mycobacteroides abscessus subsp. abscessus]|nr:Uncharacterised protein [Mycobacteroides abscessus subsp. abscessus]
MRSRRSIQGQAAGSPVFSVPAVSGAEFSGVGFSGVGVVAEVSWVMRPL